MENLSIYAKMKECDEAFKRQDYEDAVAKYTDAIVEDGSNCKLFSGRSAAYFAWEKFEEAAADAIRCIELNPNYVEGYLQHCEALKELQKYAEALESVRAGLRENPSEPQLIKLEVELESLLAGDRNTESSESKVVGHVAIDAAVGAGAGGLAAAAVAPVLNAVGFTTEGIAAGSTAAAMMSSSAVAAGGNVAAGSSIAVLQSIGAVGLAAGPAAAVVLPAVILGAALGKIFRKKQ